jgi:hypothetical protein
MGTVLVVMNGHQNLSFSAQEKAGGYGSPRRVAVKSQPIHNSALPL